MADSVTRTEVIVLNGAVVEMPTIGDVAFDNATFALVGIDHW